jgi:phosphoglycerol transferase MdoB-like AlkP superfamily enzyme
MQNYTLHVFLFIKRFLWLVLLYFISRFFFYLLNLGYFNDLSFASLIKAFIVGIRFDIAAIVFTNLVFILFLLPGSYKNNRAVVGIFDILFFTINAVALLSNFVDAKFFDFINKRSTSSIFTLLGTNKDVWMMLPQFLKDYWYVALAWIVVMFFFWRWMPRLHREKLIQEKMTLRNGSLQTLVFISIAIFMLWGARGTGLKPISLVDAAGYTKLKNVPLVLNTPFSILKTIENANLSEYHYFPQDTLISLYNPVHSEKARQPFRKMNIVVIILESFSKEYCGYLGGMKGYTPNLDSMLSQSLVFSKAFANGTQSYEAMPAIIAGIPSLMDKPYSGSNYAANIIESLPWILRKEGYHTSFFHGGNNGTMGFNNFASVAGIEHYLGRDEYNNDNDYDHNWGIWDEPYLQYFARQIENFPQPFFTSVFTLSSHHPYNVPEKYKDLFKEGQLPILKSIAYADHALGMFFRTARKMEWFDNTLFVFTADHAAQAVENKYNTTTGMFSIPLAFYCTADSSLKGSSGITAQQIDIMPTVLDYIGYNKPYFAFGHSVLNPTSQHWSVSFVNGVYQLVEEDYVMQYDGQKVLSFYKLSGDMQKISVDSPGQIVDLQVKNRYIYMERTLKAFLQTYNYCLIHNSTAVDTKNNALDQSSF